MTFIMLALISLCIIAGIVIVDRFPQSRMMTLLLGSPLVYFLSWIAWLYIWYRRIIPVDSILATFHIRPTAMGLTRILLLGIPLLPLAVFIGSVFLAGRRRNHM